MKGRRISSYEISLFWVTLFGLVFYFVAPASGQNGVCTTPNGVPGICVPVTQCASLLAILRDRQKTQIQIKFLRDSQCSNGPAVPIVCCASGGCTTADSTPGTCVSLAECPRLMQLLNGPKPLAPQTVQYLRRSACQGPARYSMCCGDQTAATTESSWPPVDVDTLLPSLDTCGKESTQIVSLQDRIVGGEATNIYRYPWMGLVEYRNNTNTISLGCGAALISSRYVITASHCVYGVVLTQLGTPINIRLGEYDKRTLVDCVADQTDKCNEEPVTVAIEKIIAHPEYRPESGSQKNDIALVRLSFDAPYTDFIRPICLPATDIEAQGTADDLFVAGWGTTETRRSSDVKLHLAIPPVPLAECQWTYTRFGAELWDKQICAGGQEGKDSCRGDSGGPLMGSTDGQWTLHGVVSFGPRICAQLDVPGVYTKVFAYVPWIRQQIRP